MSDDLRARFGDDLVALCNDDGGRVDHAVSCVAVSTDGRFVWCVGAAAATCMELSGLRVVRRVTRANRGAAVAVFASGDDPTRVTVVSSIGVVTDLLGAHRGTLGRSIGRAVFSRDGHTVATLPSAGDATREAAVWSVAPLRRLRAFPAVAPLDLSDDGSLVLHGVVGWRDLGFAFTRVSDGVTVRRSFLHPVKLAALCGDPPAALALVGDALLRVAIDPAEPAIPATQRPDGVVALLRAARHHATVRRAGHGCAVTRDDGATLRFDGPASPLVAMTPDGARVVAVSAQGGGVALGAFAHGGVTVSGAGHDDIRDLAWSPDGRAIASAARDGTLVVWDARSGESIARMETLPMGDGVALGWTPDGRSLVVWECGRALSEWSIEEGLPRWRVALPARPVVARPRVAVSPDGERIALLDGDLRVHRRGEGHACFERPAAQSVAWCGDRADAIVVVTSEPGTGLRRAWRCVDVGTGETVSEGALDAALWILATDDGTLWSQSSWTARREGVRAQGLFGAAPVALDARTRGMICAAGGALLAYGHPESLPAQVLRADGSARLVPWVPCDGVQQAISPDGSRLAVASGGRIAVVALP